MYVSSHRYLIIAASDIDFAFLFGNLWHLGAFSDSVFLLSTQFLWWDPIPAHPTSGLVRCLCTVLTRQPPHGPPDSTGNFIPVSLHSSLPSWESDQCASETDIPSSPDLSHPHPLSPGSGRVLCCLPFLGLLTAFPGWHLHSSLFVRAPHFKSLFTVPGLPIGSTYLILVFHFLWLVQLISVINSLDHVLLWFFSFFHFNKV